MSAFRCQLFDVSFREDFELRQQVATSLPLCASNAAEKLREPGAHLMMESGLTGHVWTLAELLATQ